MKIFHGACHGCTNQEIYDHKYCDGCQNRKADWSLPDLFNDGKVNSAKGDKIDNRIKELTRELENLKRAYPEYFV